MICEIFPLRPRKHGARPTVSYVLGLTSAKRGHDTGSCRYISDNGLALADVALQNGSLSPEEVNRRLCNEAATALDQQTRLNPRVRKPTWHAIISLSPEDSGSLDEADWEAISEKFMTGMGFQDCKWISTLHLDTDHQHLHLVACTVQDAPGHSVVSRYRDYDRAERLMREFEQHYHVRQIQGPACGESINHKERKPGKAAIREVIDNCLDELSQQQNPDLLDFVERLHFYGVNTKIQWRAGEPRGLSYEMDGWKSAGSKLGGKGRYTLKGIYSQGIKVPDPVDFDQLHELTLQGPSAAPVGDSATRDRTSYPDLANAAPYLSRDIRVAVSLPLAAAEKLVQSELVKPPSQIDRIGQEAVLEYRVTVSCSHIGEEADRLMIHDLVKAILRLIEQLLSLLGFNIVLTSSSASWAEDTFKAWEAPDLCVSEEPLSDQVAAQFLTKEAENEIYQGQESPSPRGAYHPK